MNETGQNLQRHGKKIIKKYILHQKVNPRLLGVEIYNKKLKTSHEAYLSCKLVFKKDIDSLMELEQIAMKVQKTWVEENDELIIKRINIFTSPAYIVLTFTIGFFESEHVRQLPFFRSCVQELIESYKVVLEQERETEYKRKEEKIYNVLEKFNQLTEKMEAIEYRLEKNEEIVLDSGELLKNELTKVSQTLKEQIQPNDYTMSSKTLTLEKSVSKHKELQSEIGEITPLKETEKDKSVSQISRHYTLVRSNQHSKKRVLKKQLKVQGVSENKERESEPVLLERTVRPKYISKNEQEVIKYFENNVPSNKRKMVPKKQFLDLKMKVEFIDYVWMLLELEGEDEIMIANEISCRKLIEELGPFMERVDKIAGSLSIFNYWVYCPQEVLIKLEGYAALKELLSSSLKRINDKALVNNIKK
ncbi:MULTISPECIES: hypothetical protein [unclassified Enterococcus]|uniref:hypothetical protein n=1 Tax=unclassified Enterococcus TaxID=2608891 RepID=UPI001CE23034|nr:MULTISPECIES: hypothetical protein [unclassified Enterococcus]MCA5014344.1 hypothetical protein [Enterococcus sp. S23]MCA5017755.1 hypothetical protein [Enterococcus sp. S22(2020)]